MHETNKSKTAIHIRMYTYIMWYSFNGWTLTVLVMCQYDVCICYG